MNWRESLEFPPEVPISEAAKATCLRYKIWILIFLHHDGVRFKYFKVGLLDRVFFSYKRW